VFYSLAGACFVECILGDRQSMNINSDINVLGGLSDFSLISFLLNRKDKNNLNSTYSSIKTAKSYKRFEKAINSTLLNFKNSKIELLLRDVIEKENISQSSLLLLFWNASANNELLNYLNQQVYFPALYSGRACIRKDEIVACLKELQETEPNIKKWSLTTIEVTASKYLTLLKKFNLMDGSVKKTITPPRLNDGLFIVFVYWLTAIEAKSNILSSIWLKYAFLEKDLFIQNIIQKKYMEFISLNYSGDNLKVEPVISYGEIYGKLTKSR